MSKHSSDIPRLIYVMGIDGSGKSTVTEHLARQLEEKGYDVDIIWLRYNNVISKPLLGLCRLLGYTRYETCDGHRIGYHNFYKSSIISHAFVFFQYLDALRVKYTKILPKYGKSNKVIILDRYVYDILIDIAVDTRRKSLLSSWFGRQFKRLLPDDSVNILVRRSWSDIIDARPEGHVDRNFESRFKLFEEIKDDEGINAIDNSGTLDELLDSASRIAGLKNES
ncbi:MAG: hypothetical protein GXP22_02395 [Gammaproteobacteria bacterium]|nr:hypothetical protein [Gammaproteobacteria bacterium]